MNVDRRLFISQEQGAGLADGVDGEGPEGEESRLAPGAVTGALDGQWCCYREDMGVELQEERSCAWDTLPFPSLGRLTEVTVTASRSVVIRRHI